MQTLKTFGRRLWKQTLFRVLVTTLASGIVLLATKYRLDLLIATHWVVVAWSSLALTIVAFLAVNAMQATSQRLDRNRDETVSGVKSTIDAALLPMVNGERRATATAVLGYVQNLQVDEQPVWQGGKGSEAGKKRARDMAVELASVISHVSQTDWT